ncbi:MAG: response regulator [Candidatus Cloacimonetes bacterium]|nr:response regulator [Candidatus Cloacimonadota bacterium]
MKTILIVDDKKMLRETLIDYLGEAKYAYYEAESGEEALDKVRENQIDLVLLDVNLPGIDGTRTLKLIKKIKPEIPVIGLTGELTIDVRNELIRSGAVDVHAKSAIYEKLLPAIDKALEGTIEATVLNENLDLVATAEKLMKENRWEESAIYLKEAGLEEELAGNNEKAKELLQEAVHRFERAGRSGKAKQLRDLLEDM